MEIHKPETVTFMKTFQRNEPIIMDATAIMTYKTCPLKYFYRIVLGMAPKITPPYFAFGTAYHKYREKLEFGIINGLSETQSHTFAVAEAVKYAMNHFSKGTVEAKWSHLTIDLLKKSCNVAFEHWLKERIEGGITVVAFEQPFTLDLDGYWFAGRADQIIKRKNSQVWGRDFKTTSKFTPFYQRGLEPNFQFTGYTWGESKLSHSDVQGQIVEVLVNERQKNNIITKIEPLTTTRTKGQIERWKKDTLLWLSMIDTSRKLDHYPMNEKHCTFCEYHSVCKAPTESGQMSQLRTYFKHQPWDCTKTDQEEAA